jgi:NhaA family Na+:H+ antiporter
MNLHESRSQPGSLSIAPNQLPDAPVNRWMRPFVRFLKVESASGVVLLLSTVIALVLANSPWGGAFADLWKTHLRVALGPWEFNETLLHCVNDGLMTIFFFVVGLEIKRELVAGELRDGKKAALPVMAALGGMVAPAAIYLLLRSGQPGQAGWGIPMATDIAFVVGFLALLGPRVPFGLKILLLCLAIADDIGAVLVIACFYSTNISFAALGLAALGFGLIYFFNRIGVRRVPVYVVVGAGIWLAFLKSGIHPTVAGVLLGLLTPALAWVGDRALVAVLGDVLHKLQAEQDGQIEHHHIPMLAQLETAAREAVSPLERLETTLHPWVAFGIMPIFALANAGFRVEPAALGHPVALAVAAGLILGKPIGIVLFSWLAVRIGLARLPTGVNWKVMLGAGCLAGIGFTMSLFIAGLALDGELLDAGKIGTLTGSTLSAVLGSLLLLKFLPRRSVAVAGQEHGENENYQAEESPSRSSSAAGR